MDKFLEKIKNDIENKNGIAYIFLIIYIFTFINKSASFFSLFRIIYLVVSTIILFITYKKYGGKSLKNAIYFILLLLLISIIYYYKEFM